MKIAIGGQLEKHQILEWLHQYAGDAIQAEIFTDMDAAIKVKNGNFDYYVGACQSGAGGALAMAYALIGRDKCATIANALKQPSEQEVRELLAQGKKAFGFTNDRAENAIKALVSVWMNTPS
jgi:hypothetical protein